MIRRLRFHRALAFALLTMVAGVLHARQQRPNPSLPPLDISLAAGASGSGGRMILPGRPTDLIDCGFSVHEPGTGNLYAERHITLRRGDRKSVTAVKETLSFTFLAEVPKNGGFAALKLTVTPLGGPASTYSSSVWLCPDPKGSKQ